MARPPWRVIAMSAQAEAAHRSETVLRLVRLVLSLYLFHVLWWALFSDPHAARVAYSFTLYGAIQQFFSFRNPDRLGDRIRDGGAVYLFSRPMPPGLYYLWQESGRIVVAAAALTACLPAAAAIGLATPLGPGALLILFVMSAAGMSVAALLDQLVELSSVWLLDNTGLRMLAPFVVVFCSGGFVPLDLCPQWFQELAHALPFQAMADLPVRAALRLANPAAMLAEQAAWTVGLALVTTWVWRRAAQRVTVSGW